MPASNYKIPQYGIPASLMSWVRLGHKSLVYYHPHQSSTHSQLCVQSTLLRIHPLPYLTQTRMNGLKISGT